MARIIRLTESDLTKMVKRVMKEYFHDDLSDLGSDPEDIDNEDEPFTKKPSKPGNSKRYGSFGGDEWVSDEDEIVGKIDFDDEFDTEEFDDYDSYRKKYSDRKDRWFGKGDEGRRMFDLYKEKRKSPLTIKTRRNRMD